MIRHLVWHTRLSRKNILSLVKVDPEKISGEVQISLAGVLTPNRPINQTMATEFIVLDRLALSLKITRSNGATYDYLGHLQMKVNTTEYFQYPDGSRSLGVSNVESYYPGNVKDQDLYILPGQNWDIYLSVDIHQFQDDDDYIDVYVGYTYYDREHATAAYACLNDNRSVCPHNVVKYVPGMRSID